MGESCAERAYPNAHLLPRLRPDPDHHRAAHSLRQGSARYLVSSLCRAGLARSFVLATLADEFLVPPAWFSFRSFLPLTPSKARLCVSTLPSQEEPCLLRPSFPRALTSFLEWRLPQVQTAARSHPTERSTRQFPRSAFPPPRQTRVHNHWPSQ
jgi:hypothetical protein